MASAWSLRYVVVRPIPSRGRHFDIAGYLVAVMADPEGNAFDVFADAGHPAAGRLAPEQGQRALMMSSTRSLASPKSIAVLSLKNSGFCTPA